MSKQLMKEAAQFIPLDKLFPTYAEEGQDFPVKFESCFSSKEQRDSYYVAHGPVKCRDFLGDIACSRFFGQKYSIYGFTADVHEWRKNEDFSPTSWNLRVTFPKPENRIYFLKNFNHVLNIFNIGSSFVNIQTYLTDPANTLLISMPASCSPIFVSFFTFLIKISGQKMMGINEFEQVLTSGDPIKFIEVFKKHYNNKDASYFNRISPDLVPYIPLIISIATSKQAFSYLIFTKDNVGYLHNNSGFFSQFNKETYGKDQKIFRSIIGTIIKKTQNKVPFDFLELSDEALNQLLEKTTYNFIDPNGKVWLGYESEVSDHRKIEIRQPKKKPPVKLSEDWTTFHLGTQADEAEVNVALAAIDELLNEVDLVQTEA